MRRTALVALLAALGCDPSGQAERALVGRRTIMWDALGEAWVIEHHVGNTWTVGRLPDADRDPCPPAGRGADAPAIGGPGIEGCVGCPPERPGP